MSTSRRGPRHGGEGFGGEVHSVDARDQDPEQKQNKVAIVGKTDDVEHPRTVVIHVQDEFSSDVVVVRTRSLRSLTVLAVSPLVRISLDPRGVPTTRSRSTERWRLETVDVAILFQFELGNLAL